MQKSKIRAPAEPPSNYMALKAIFLINPAPPKEPCGQTKKSQNQKKSAVRPKKSTKSQNQKKSAVSFVIFTSSQ
jgi:hypothetical protein